MTQGYRQYSKAYQKAAVNTLDQRKMIVLLYDGAIKFLSIAVNKLASGDGYESHVNMMRGKSIIAELLASLDMDRGGDIALNLQRLYAYMFNELIEANLERDVERIKQVVEMLKQLRDAWKDMDPPRNAQPDAAGPAGPGQNPRVRKVNLRG